MSNYTPKRVPISSQLAQQFCPPAGVGQAGMSVMHIRAAVAQQEKLGSARKGPYGLGLGVQGV